MWNSGWDKIFKDNEWGKYPCEELIRFISRKFHVSKNRKISFEEYPSITDKNGRILLINKIEKLNTEYD